MFKYILKKEFLLIFRNMHAMMVLFIMPSVFIIIMSLALKNSYSNSIDTKFKTIILTNEISKDIQRLEENIKKNNFFEIELSTSQYSKKEFLYEKGYDFVIEIPSNFTKIIQNNKDVFIDIYTPSNISFQNINHLKQLLSGTISQMMIKNLLLQLDIDTTKTKNFNQNIRHHYLAKNEAFNKTTSVQQSVPAWLIFSMFFILIPISNTFINEKNFGTIDRIKTINISLFPILLGKVFPYYIMNQIQVFLMILMGIYLMPLLGGDKLMIYGEYSLIFITSSIISLAAISFALVIANIAKTTEDATTLGGISNILLAALGGIMVPKFIMPQFMQDISEFSPMSWALDSFLEIFVKGGTFVDIQGYLLRLIIFSIICFFTAYLILNKKGNK